MRPRRIGVIGGVGPAATVLYYRLLIEGLLARSAGRVGGEVVIDSLDLQQFERWFQRRDEEALAERVGRAVEGLAQAGCDSVVMACNSMHVVYDRVAAGATVPIVPLIDVVADEAERRGLSRLGLLAATFTVRTGLYAGALAARGIECLVPPDPEQAWLMKAILEDFQRPVVSDAAMARLLDLARALAARGAEAIALGCTDLPAGFEVISPIPVLDGARLHVEAVLDLAPASDPDPAGGA